MPRFNNLSIGTKLGITSSLGVLLVVGMIGAMIYGDFAVTSARERADHAQSMIATAALFKAAARGMQVGVLAIRLAASPEELQKADAGFAERKKSADELVEQLLRGLRKSDNHERAVAAKDLVERYYAAGKEVLPIKAQIFATQEMQQVGGAGAPDAAARVAALTAQMIDITRNRALPMIVEMDKLVDAMVTTTNGTADQSVAEATKEMASVEYINIGFGLIIVVVLIGSIAVCLATIARPIRRLIGVLAQIEKGNTKVEVKGTERGDEIGSLAKAVVVIRAARDAELVNDRITTGLEVVRASVMLADEQYNIIYMNATLQKMFTESEAEMRKALPRFDAGALIGVNMEVFHNNPAHQRSLLDALTKPHETGITIGTKKFFAVITPVFDKAGKRAGTVVEWQDRTAQIAAEAEIDSLVTAAIAGDFSRRVPTEGKKDFMLVLVTAMNRLCENISSAADDVGRMLAAIAEGDLTQRITAEYQGEFGELKNNANSAAERIGLTVAEIKQAASEISNASVEISTSATDLSQRTEEQAASLEQTSASMEEIASTVKQNSDNAQVANEFGSQGSRRGGSGRQGCRQGGRRHGPDRCFRRQDFRHHWRHR